MSGELLPEVPYDERPIVQVEGGTALIIEPADPQISCRGCSVTFKAGQWMVTAEDIDTRFNGTLQLCQFCVRDIGRCLEHWPTETAPYVV